MAERKETAMFSKISNVAPKRGRRPGRRGLALAGFVFVVGLASAPPVAAHEGHRSCAPAAEAYVPPGPGGLGDLASTVGKSGEFKEFTEAFHAGLCEPAP